MMDLRVRTQCSGGRHVAATAEQVSAAFTTYKWIENNQSKQFLD